MRDVSISLKYNRADEMDLSSRSSSYSSDNDISDYNTPKARDGFIFNISLITIIPHSQNS